MLYINSTDSQIEDLIQGIYKINEWFIKYKLLEGSIQWIPNIGWMNCHGFLWRFSMQLWDILHIFVSFLVRTFTALSVIFPWQIASRYSIYLWYNLGGASKYRVMVILGLSYWYQRYRHNNNRYSVIAPYPSSFLPSWVIQTLLSLGLSDLSSFNWGV